MVRDDPQADREQRHPTIRIDPITGRESLNVSPTYTTRLSGMSEQDSTPILDAVYRHATKPDFCCRYKWQPGDLVVWDNRYTLHYATNDYPGARRLLYRTAFGEQVRA